MEGDVDNIQTDDKWYYVIVQDPGTSTEQVVGYNDDKTNEKFIPAFQTKEQAQACFLLMPKDLFNGKFDTQAFIEDDLLDIAEQAGHKIYLLDEKGTLLEYLN